MQDFETICFENRADWLRLLAAYAQSEELAAQAEAAAARQSAKQAAKAATAPVPVAAPAVFAESTIGNNDTDGEESATGWVSRISLLDGVEAAALSTLHGRLIALGYLKFKLIDRQIGLRYRLTPAGKQMAQSRPDETLTAAA
jgi:hypothetical protein